MTRVLLAALAGATLLAACADAQGERFGRAATEVRLTGAAVPSWWTAWTVQGRRSG
jgi:ABC-type dipeptide/oligopeptide/nickel transport system permease component